MVFKKCVKCTKNITKKLPGLECSRCNKVVHADPECAKLSNKQLSTLRNANSIEWSCETCLQNMSRRSSFITPEDDADDDSDTGTVISPQPLIDQRRLAQDINRELKKTIKDEVGNLEASLDFLSDQINTLQSYMKTQDSKIKDLEQKNLDLYNRNKNLELRVAALEQGKQQHEQNNLSLFVEVAGLPDVSPKDVGKVMSSIAAKLEVDEQDV